MVLLLGTISVDAMTTSKEKILLVTRYAGVLLVFANFVEKKSVVVLVNFQGS